MQSFLNYVLLWFTAIPKSPFNDAERFLSVARPNTNWVHSHGPVNILGNLLDENHPDFRMPLTSQQSMQKAAPIHPRRERLRGRWFVIDSIPGHLHFSLSSRILGHDRDGRSKPFKDVFQAK